MLKDKLQIIDSMFSHAHSSSWYNHPTEFEWVREDTGDKVVFTDTSVHQVSNITSKKKYAWLLESPLVTSSQYKFVKENFDKFDKVFTFDSELLGLSPKFTLVPLGGCWIEPKDRLVHPKTKNLSTIVSSKSFLPGHQLRHDIINTFSDMDVFGGGYSPIENKISGLREYRFHIVVENCKKDYYFSEKLIDCFVTGVIPIYWGCPSIGDFFDIDGILTFDSIGDLGRLLSNLTEELYLDRLQSINNNFVKSQDFIVADDILYKKIKND